MAEHEECILPLPKARTPLSRPIPFPQFFDIKEDVKESYELWGNDGYAHAWVMGPVSKILAGLAGSMQKYPNIKPGQEFSGYN